MLPRSLDPQNIGRVEFSALAKLQFASQSIFRIYRIYSDGNSIQCIWRTKDKNHGPLASACNDQLKKIIIKSSN